MLSRLGTEGVEKGGLDLDHFCSELFAVEVRRRHLAVELLLGDVPGQNTSQTDGDPGVGILDVTESLRPFRPLYGSEELPSVLGDRRRLHLRHRWDCAENQQKNREEFQDQTTRFYHSYKGLGNHENNEKRISLDDSKLAQVTTHARRSSVPSPCIGSGFSRLRSRLRAQLFAPFVIETKSNMKRSALRTRGFIDGVVRILLGPDKGDGEGPRRLAFVRPDILSSARLLLDLRALGPRRNIQ